MLGCLRRVGCLVLLLAIVCGAYFTRHRWLPLVTPGAKRAAASVEWKPLSAAGAARARSAISRFDGVNGPVFSNVGAADFASYVLDSTSLGFTDGSRPADAAVRDDRFLLRTQLKVSELGVGDVPFLSSLTNKTVVMIITGTLAVERKGLGEWRVKGITLDALDVPGPVISRVARSLATRVHRTGAHDDALGFAVPAQVADLRIHNGTITLYKAAK